MAHIETLTEEEAYLWAILSDPSGLDQAEFSWFNAEDKESNCFRAWPFQWKWWRCMEPQQIDQCGRSVGKSLSIKVRCFAFPFIHPGQEMVLTAPEGNHLDAITDNVETSFLNTRLGKEMLVKSRSGLKHRPFHMNFANGARIMGRIPQRDGKGVKGIHPIWLELDEAQDYPKDGWIEIFETVKESAGATWRAHGVTRGVRDFFNDFTQPDSGWKVHQYMAMHRPTWSDEKREKQIAKYGSSDHPDYKRNVYGLHGDATNPIFVLHRLMACVDIKEESNYNTHIYTKLKINNEMVLDYNDDILALIDFPRTHLAFKNTWIGMDVGYTNDPSEILVFAEQPGIKPQDPVKLMLISRIAMQRVNHPNQVSAILWLINFYKPHAFAMDKTGLGLPLFQDIQDRAKRDPNIKHMLDRIKGYNFSEKILVEYDDTMDVDPRTGKVLKEAEMKRNVLEYSTDKLRDLVDGKRLILPNDKEIIGEFQGQTFSYDKAQMDLYGRARNFSKGSFHTLDAARMAALGWAQHRIDVFQKEKDKFTPVMPVFL